MPTSSLNPATQSILAIPDLLTFWDFQPGPLIARGPYPYQLHETGAPIPRASEGRFGPASLILGNAGHLSIPRDQCPALDIHGPSAQVSIIAWIKRTPAPADQSGCQALAGIWNEHAKRQYALFLNLHLFSSAEQVCAHISATGAATPGHKYCMEVAIGQTPVPLNTWQCVAITYDAHQARAYLNGALDSRPGRNPFPLPGGIFSPGLQGADFTVGAVERPQRVDDQLREHGSIVANRFHGLLAGLAIFNRALSDNEIHSLAALTHS
jgi:hypothetical protein